MGRAAESERRRERKLREDPLVTVQSPQLVVCNRCGATIKLSLKSAYDPFHWQRHRERCLKRPDAVVQGMKDATASEKVRPRRGAPQHLIRTSLTRVP